MNSEIHRKVLSSFLPGLVLVALAVAGPVAYAGERPLYVTYSFVAHNPSDRVMHDRDARFVVPLAETPFQTVEELSIRPDLPHVDVSTPEQGAVNVRFPLLAPYQSALLRFEVRLVMRSKDAGGEALDTEPFLQPSWLIESDHPDLVAEASGLAAEDPGVTARRAYQWIRRHVAYSSPRRGESGALHAWRHRVGDCTETARLFVAFCRAAKVPARLLEGYVTPANSVLRPGDLHNWAEYHDGNGWRVVDLQSPVFEVDPAHYLAMSAWGRTPDRPDHAFHRFMTDCEVLSIRMNAD